MQVVLCYIWKFAWDRYATFVMIHGLFLHSNQLSTEHSYQFPHTGYD